MQIDSANLLTNLAFVAIGILAVGFLVWFLIALTLEKNGVHARSYMKFHIDEAMDRRPIREVAAPRRWPEGLGSAQSVLKPTHILVTHRARLAVAQAKNEVTEKPWQPKPYLTH